jgi:hypothetical protein
MDGTTALLIMLVLIAIGIGITGRRSGGVIVKDNPASKKPKVGAAPQPMRRTKEEQELHEWLENNPR